MGIGLVFKFRSRLYLEASSSKFICTVVFEHGTVRTVSNLLQCLNWWITLSHADTAGDTIAPVSHGIGHHILDAMDIDASNVDIGRCQHSLLFGLFMSQISGKNEDCHIVDSSLCNHGSRIAVSCDVVALVGDGFGRSQFYFFSVSGLLRIFSNPLFGVLWSIVASR